AAGEEPAGQKRDPDRARAAEAPRERELFAREPFGLRGAPDGEQFARGMRAPVKRRRVDMPELQAQLADAEKAPQRVGVRVVCGIEQRAGVDEKDLRRTIPWALAQRAGALGVAAVEQHAREQAARL